MPDDENRVEKTNRHLDLLLKMCRSIINPSPHRLPSDRPVGISHLTPTTCVFRVLFHFFRGCGLRSSPTLSLQDPNDPTTFPPPVSDGQSSLTYLTTVSPGGAQGQGQGRYSGIPEI